MLKALELVGFKSFADKTRFEFPRGITVVVGPNGSGKSNVVDAIKWVLGEQSVKSLRGKEMADVIFNGSANRRALNAAETTLTFDNSDRLLAVDTSEVHITRRVYRSGEGEYLINRQPCRLRDIRDLFAGTGLSTEAYSVIEQGKVDVLLQSSPRDRRMIFEEAAGISRFKAKKLEAIRRLERIDQNLLRLSDIVDEVESRLRSVRAQATKARKYKEYADRLQALRTQVAQADWRKLSNKLAELETDLNGAREENATALAHLEAVEAETLSIEAQVAESDTAMRTSQARVAQNRERIATHETAIEHQRRRVRDLEDEVSRYQRQLSSMSVRAGDLQQQLQELADNLVAAEQENREVARRLAEEERTLTRLTSQVDELRAENEQYRSAQLERLRLASTLGKEISALESKVAATKLASERGGQRLAELAATRDRLSAETGQLRTSAEQVERFAAERQAALRQAQAQLAGHREQFAQLQKQLHQLRERHSGAAERAVVLEELEKRLEGISAGVKQLLVASQSAAAGPLRQIRGLVADLLHVNFETAPLVEAALGELAQCLVVADGHELVAHLQNSVSLSGRVGIIRLDVIPPKTQLDQLDLHGQSGVLGRADEFVETAPEFAVLARRLLGKTWIVEDLDRGLALSESIGRGLNFVTRAGELVSADGTLVLGPRHASAGLISRRSELRVLKHQVAEMAAQIEKQQATADQLERTLIQEEQATQALAADFQATSQQLGQVQLRLASAEENLSQTERQHCQLELEVQSAQAEHERTVAALGGSREELTKLESAMGDLESRIAEGSRRAAEFDQSRGRAGREANATRIDVAKSEQRLAHLIAQKSQLERDQQERARALADSRAQLISCRAKLKQAERDILQRESRVAELYLQKEALAVEAGGHAQQRDAWRQQKSQLAVDAQRTRNRIRKLEARLHSKELSAGEVRHERTTLADRLREDYGIELAGLEHEPTAEELEQRAEVDLEIADLRSKINSIGGVNLDALAELEELEARFATLSTQHQDLSAAKNSLEQIIGKINEDSRRLFTDTLEVVREHFQALFRKLFGGGQADIVLDEGVDILDSGIEIVARPPGKEPRNISLLSGGEKTLTCVALLLAIFRSRPSPFCVLDEVDAALDEANIERFVGVLQEFLTWTQFIVVTHSKKTMTCANTLYGITMQESGISKRVSVRFEDVSDDGEILNVRDSDPGEPAKDETQAA